MSFTSASDANIHAQKADDFKHLSYLYCLLAVLKFGEETGADSCKVRKKGLSVPEFPASLTYCTSEFFHTSDVGHLMPPHRRAPAVLYLP